LLARISWQHREHLAECAAELPLELLEPLECGIDCRPRVLVLARRGLDRFDPAGNRAVQRVHLLQRERLIRQEHVEIAVEKHESVRDLAQPRQRRFRLRNRVDQGLDERQRRVDLRERIEESELPDLLYLTQLGEDRFPLFDALAETVERIRPLVPGVHAGDETVGFDHERTRRLGLLREHFFGRLGRLEAGGERCQQQCGERQRGDGLA